MTYTAPPYLVWVLLGVGLAIASSLTHRELKKSKEKPQTDNLGWIVVDILKKIHERDLKLKNAAKKQYLTLFNLNDFIELWDNYAITRGGGEIYESIKREFAEKELEKDKIQRRKQIDDLQERLNTIIEPKEWTLEEYIKLASFFENFPKTQNGVYRGIGRRRETDRKWQASFHSLNNLRLEHAQVFVNEELTQMIDEYFDNSKIAVTGRMIIELMETLVPRDVLSTQYLEMGIEDANIKISNRMTKLLEDISKKITEAERQHTEQT